MNTDNHVAILAAYLGAMPQMHIDAIQQTQRAAMCEAMNGNRASLNAANADAREAIAQAIANMSPYDLARIEATLCAQHLEAA